MALISDPMNLGPLTTVFTAPLACSTDALYVNNNRDCAGSVSVLRGPVATSSGGRCFPPSFDGRAGAYYSPGLCPQGYTVACTSVLAGNTAASEPAETVLTCCPRAAQGLTYGCSAGPEWSWGGCHATLGGATVTLTGATTVECGTTRDAGPDFVWDGVAQAQSVQVRFRAGDESLFETGRDTAPATATPTPSPSDGVPPAAGGTEPALRASDNAQETAAAEGAGSPPAAPAAPRALVAVAASCGTIMALALAAAALLFVRARRVARELRDREQQLSDRFYHAAKPSHNGGGGDDDGNLATVVTVTATATPPPPTTTTTTSPAPVAAAPPAPPTPAFAAAAGPPAVSPLSVAGARLADTHVTPAAPPPPPAELGTAPQYEMEGSPVVRPRRGRQAPFPPPAPAVQTASPTVGKAVTTQELSPVSETESPA